MLRPTPRPAWQSAVVALSMTVCIFLFIGSLYWGRTLLIPLAMAIFFTFVLVPVVAWLQKWGLGRIPAVLISVASAVLLFAAGVYVLGQQIALLTQSLPDKEPVIRAKVERMKSWFTSGDSRLGHFFDTMQSMTEPPKPSEEANAQKALVLEPANSAWANRLQSIVSPMIDVAGQSAFAFILVIFMLIRREDLRNRFLRLVGHDRLTTATKAVDDATRRLSRYLLSQLLLNMTFGCIIALALLTMGVEYAILWGFIAAVMRYVPYVGTWIAAVLPVLFSFATSSGLAQPAGIFVLYIGLELLCGNVIEPRLYGHSLGISEVAQLIAAGFWSFLWGPVGLILSGPLTTCLVVLGKHVPALRFLDILLGDEPPLDAGVVLFQRLTARDTDEAARLLRAELKATDDPVIVFDRVVLPALRHLRQTTLDGNLDVAEESIVLEGLREILADETEPVAIIPADGPRVRVLVCPARDATDEVAADLFARLLSADRWEAEVTTADTLTAEFVARVADFAPAIVVVCSLPPGGLAHTRLMCKRLKARQPEVRVVVGRWGAEADATSENTELLAVGASVVCANLANTRDQLQEWLPVLQAAIGTNPASISPVLLTNASTPISEGAPWPRSAIK